MSVLVWICDKLSTLFLAMREEYMTVVIIPGKPFYTKQNCQQRYEYISAHDAGGRGVLLAAGSRLRKTAQPSH